MKKAKIFNKDGKIVGEIELSNLFDSNIREDICQKYVEIIKRIQPYSNFYLAGKQHSASGKIKHARNKWKTAYGRGISRVPRKIMWRRGGQFYWVGAFIAGAVGGKRAHPPRVEHFLKEKKINKKEKKLAIASALTSTTLIEWLKKRYSTLKNKEIKIDLPIVVKNDVLKLKSRDFFKFLEKILNDLYDIAIKKKKRRAGKGKMRNRPYKTNAGLLFVIGNEEKFKVKGIEIKKVNELNIKDFWPLGRLVIYSENAIKEINEKFKLK